MSLSAEFVFGFTFSAPLAVILAVGFFIGFWSIADSGIYKAALTENVPEAVKSTALGVQSAFGYLATIISPLVFSFVLAATNPTLSDSGQASVWSYAFITLGLGALLVPVSIIYLQRRQARTRT